MCVCVCGVRCVLCCVCGEIHCGTYGPNNFEIVVGAFVVWCPPKYLWCVCVVCGVSCGVCVCVCGEIHGETDGPNSREMVVGAFVAGCSPKYM